MPTYEYLCTSCQNEWEEIQKISEGPIEVCPKCGKSTARRQISGGNFILKGGGWYADLYSSSKPKTSGDANGKSETSGGGEKAGKAGETAAPKADAKAETKTEAKKPDPKPASSSGSS
jgi:putative FmdB family regulatory protein